MTGKRRRALGWLAALAFVTAACGNRLSHQQLLADSRGGTASAGSAVLPGDQSGSTSSAAGPAATGTSGLGGTTGPSGSTAAGSTGGATGSGTTGAPSTGAGASSSGSTSAVSPQVSSSSGAACTKPRSTVTIGSVGAQSGVVGASVNGTNAIRAWVAYINAKGGLNCHPVKYVVADDGSDPSRNQADIQQLVEQDHVIAFVYNDAPLDGQASVAYLNQHRIPVIGTESAEGWAYSSPMFFLQGDNGPVQDQDLFNNAAYIEGKQGHRNAAVGIFACVEAQACSTVYSAGPGYAQKAGLRLVYRAQVSLTQPDFTAECQSAKSAGAQAIMLYVDVNSIDRVLRSCSSIDYHPQYAAYSLAAALSTANDPLANGLIAALGDLPWLVTSNSAVQQFRQTMAQYAPGAEVGLKETLAWAAAKLFELAGQNLSEPPTSDSILQGLWAIKNQNLGGLTPALTFTKDQPPPKVGCNWVVQVESGHWTSPDNGQMHCQ